MKIAIVTGGNKGIGLGIVKELIKNNYKVITGGRSSYEDEETKDKVEFIQGNLINYETHQRLVETAIKKYGRLDLYVNNVGISEWRPIDQIDSIEKEMISLLGTKVNVKHKKNGSGSIIIKYYSNDDLERLLELLKSIEKK